MKRRTLLSACLALAPLPSSLRAAPPPWQARLLKGGFDGRYYRLGLHLTLEKHWKTYWRVPGSGGVSPQIDVAAPNLKAFAVDMPLPQRFEEEQGEAIGYQNEVVFLVKAEPANAAQPLALAIKSFFGVCEVVCIPAGFDGNLSFSPQNADAPDQSLLNSWQRRVPVIAKNPAIRSAKLEQQAEGFSLLLETARPLRDIFVESPTQHYFSKPVLSKDLATIAVKTAGDPAELRGQVLRLTLDDQGQGLEQSVTVV